MRDLVDQFDENERLWKRGDKVSNPLPDSSIAEPRIFIEQDGDDEGEENYD